MLVLHVGYAFVPIGFLLLGAALLWPAIWPASAGLHAWTAGAIGIMTLAVMTRATPRTYRPAAGASPATQAIYALVLVRRWCALPPHLRFRRTSSTSPGRSWCLAFGGFAVVYGPLLVGRPPVWAAAKQATPESGGRARRSLLKRLRA